MPSESAVKKPGIFLKKIFLLCLFVFLADKLVFLAVREGAYHFYRSHSSNADHLLEHIQPNFYDTLIMGTSRSFQALLPAHFKNFLNLKSLQVSLKGKYPKYNFLFYKKFRKLSAPPKYVFYGMDYQIFLSGSWKRLLAPFSDSRNPVRRMPIIQMNHHGKIRYWDNLSLLLAKKRKIDRFIHDLAEITRLAKNNPQPLISPYLGRTVNKVNLKKPLRPIILSPYRKFPGVEGRYLLKLLELLEKDGVEVFLVVLPDYIGSYRSLANIRAYYKDIFNLASGFRNTHMLNLHKPGHFPINNHKMFSDGGLGKINCHLSAAGARKLTEILCGELSRISSDFTFSGAAEKMPE